MGALDMSIVNVALPHIRGTLGASVEEIAWVATGYMLSNVITMPIIALLSSRFGRKRFYLFSVALFTCASMACGLARDLPSMVVFRVIQGIGGGAPIPLAQAILRETFPPQRAGEGHGHLRPRHHPGAGLRAHPRRVAHRQLFLALDLLYQRAGGYSSTSSSSCALSKTRLTRREKVKMDFSGLLFMSIGLGALQIMLEKGDQKDWFASHFIVYLAVAAFLGLLFFVIRELTTDAPAVNLRILKDINFSSGTLLSGILGMGLFSSLFILPLFLQQLLGYPALNSGIMMMPRSFAMAVGMPLAGRIYNRVGAKLLIAVGLFINAVSYFQLGLLSLDTGYWDIFVPQVLQGIGSGLYIRLLEHGGALDHRKTPFDRRLRALQYDQAGFRVRRHCAWPPRSSRRGRPSIMPCSTEHVTASRDVASDSLRQFSSYLASQGVNVPRHRDGGLKTSGWHCDETGEHACLQPCLLSYCPSLPCFDTLGCAHENHAPSGKCGSDCGRVNNDGGSDEETRAWQ